MARYNTSRWLGSFIGCGFALLTFVQSAQAESVSFVRDIKPILSNACFHCHGPDEADRKGGTDGLRLDTFEGATADLGGGAQAIKAGHPEASEMIERILSTDPDLVMPPPSVGRKLSPRQVDLLKKWISEGAKYEPHWSYVKPVRPTVVATQHQPDQSPAVMAGAIDELVQRKLKELNLKPAPEADREALIRRVSLDLTGLPPHEKKYRRFLKIPLPTLTKRSSIDCWPVPLTGNTGLIAGSIWRDTLIPPGMPMIHHEPSGPIAIMSLIHSIAINPSINSPLSNWRAICCPTPQGSSVLQRHFIATR